MDKMRMETLNKTAMNVKKIGELFPNCITEKIDENGHLKKAINFDLLRQMLSDDVVEGDEVYEFSWVGKKAAIVEANKPIRKTLRPCPEESVDWDTTENLYIEGDNLEVLKLLQESYLGKVKMIYIDPPYNTGNDFIYRDDFKTTVNDYEEKIGLITEEGIRLFKNTDTNGRFHSDWCSMLYPRLMLARNLLTDDGLIFISIDDNEYSSLKAMCDEVFGETSFLATFVWRRRVSSALDKSKCSTDHEYIIAYKMKDFVALRGIDKDYKGYSNPDNDPRGPWTTGDLTVGMTGDMRPNQYYDLIDPKTGIVYKANYNRVWSYIPESMEEMIKDNRIVFPNDPSKRPMKKRFLSELDSSTNPQSTWMDNVGMNTESTKMMYELFGKSFFSYTKPESLIRALILQATDQDSIILDFFSGSATTAHSVIKQNLIDGGHRRFIMVQLPEETGENSEAEKSGYKTICDIGKERIRRVGKKIKEENPLTTQDLDTGFRVFRLDESNMNDVYYKASDYNQIMLSLLESNIKDDRSDLDLLFGCLLEWGLPLSMPYNSEKINGYTIHTYNEGDLIACFENDLPDSIIKEIAQRQPLRAVFRESCFNGSPAKINVVEIFKMLAPSTKVKVI